MSVRTQRGFTLIEVMLSVVLLTVGVMALVSSSAMTARMIGRGRSSTLIGQRSSTRFDYLRQLAASTSPPCTAANFANGTNNIQDHIQESWTLTQPNGANTRLARVILSYKAAGRTKADTVQTLILCK
jgi:prepilin-type N-terminal cleavage/methylation domain-containing protein